MAAGARSSAASSIMPRSRLARPPPNLALRARTARHSAREGEGHVPGGGDPAPCRARLLQAGPGHRGRRKGSRLQHAKGHGAGDPTHAPPQTGAKLSDLTSHWQAEAKALGLISPEAVIHARHHQRPFSHGTSRPLASRSTRLSRRPGLRTLDQPAGMSRVRIRLRYREYERD
jgi:hypothetical protein